MEQLGFFDLSRRYECLDAKNDPLVAIAALVPWECFRPKLRAALINQTEYQLRDRLSFMRFLGLGIEDAFPDAKTLWLYREALAKAGAVEELFDLFDTHLKDKGYLAIRKNAVHASLKADASRQCPA